MQDAFHADLKRYIEQEIVKRSELISIGTVPSMEEYRKATGYIAALRDVLTMCQEVQRRLYGDNPLKGAYID